MNLLKNDISSQLSEIFNISFSSGVFPSILKTAKAIPVHKKDSKLRRVTRGGGGGGGFPCPFSKIGKKCPNLEKKCPDCGHHFKSFLARKR